MNKLLEIEYGGNSSDNPVYEVKGTKKNFTIYAAGCDLKWLNPGEECVIFNDTGDDLILKIYDRTIKLNYLEAELLRLALKLNEPTIKLYEITKRRV